MVTSFGTCLAKELKAIESHLRYKNLATKVGKYIQYTYFLSKYIFYFIDFRKLHMARSNHVIKTIAIESALAFHLGPFSPSFLES